MHLRPPIQKDILFFYGLKGWVDFVPPEIYDRALESSMFELENGKMKMNMDLDMNGYSVINAREDYFRIKGYYKSSVNNNNVLFGNNAFFTKVPFGGYLIEVYALITTDGVGNDNKYRLIIRGHEHYTSNINLVATDNFKFQRFMNFRKNLFLPSGRGFIAGISHDMIVMQQFPQNLLRLNFSLNFFRNSPQDNKKISFKIKKKYEGPF